MIIYIPNRDGTIREFTLYEKTCEAQYVTYSSLRESADIPKIFHTANLNGFGEGGLLFQYILDGRPFYVSGNVGTGKTHLLCAVMNFYNAVQSFGHHRIGINPIQNVPYNYNMYSRFFIHHTEFDELKFNVDKIAKIPQLFIDDLGTGRNTEFTQSRIERLINIRYNENLPLWFTTNLTDEKLEEYVGSRIYRRITQISNAFYF